jgi:hypothetical protein
MWNDHEGWPMKNGGRSISAMKHDATRFKDLKVALKEIEPLIRDPRHLQTGKPFEKFGGMRPREMVANWLLCAAIQAVEGHEMMFYTDPLHGDGIIRDEATGQTFPTEHVYVSQYSTGPNAQTLILNAINHKQAWKDAYAAGKTLVVFLDTPAVGQWYPTSVARVLPNPLHYAAVWVVGFSKLEGEDYIYGLTMLDPSQENAPAVLVRIHKEFDAWEVVQIQ